MQIRIDEYKNEEEPYVVIFSGHRRFTTMKQAKDFEKKINELYEKSKGLRQWE